MSNSSQFCTICELAGGALCPSTQVINEDAKQYRPQYQLLGHTTDDLPPARLCVTDDKPPGRHSASSLSTSLSTYLTHQPRNATGDSVKILIQVEVKNIHCSPCPEGICRLPTANEHYWEYYYFS